jgi:hypothetical protein
MIRLRSVSNALGIGVAVAIMAGCGGSQATVTNGMPQAPGSATQVSQRESRAFPRTTSQQDLLYVADGKSDIVVLSYPDGSPVQTLSIPSEAWGLCSDASGDVFVTEYDAYQVVEYAHGGTSPINTLPLNQRPADCSWDPTTGNLAVVEHDTPTIAIFNDAQGSAQSYSDSNFTNFDYCAYDDNGNLFVDGVTTKGGEPVALTKFSTTTGEFTDIALPKKLPGLGALQWDGKYLAIDDAARRSNRIYQVEVSGSSGKVVGTTSLSGRLNQDWMWIQNDTVIFPIYEGRGQGIGLWAYPAGGKPTKTLPRDYFPAKGPIRGVTVSLGST